MASLTSCTGVLMDAGVWYLDQRSCCLVPAASSNAPAASTNAPLVLCWHIFFAAFSRAVASALSVASWGIFFRGVLALPLHGSSRFRGVSRRPREALRFKGACFVIDCRCESFEANISWEFLVYLIFSYDRGVRCSYVGTEQSLSKA